MKELFIPSMLPSIKGGKVTKDFHTHRCPYTLKDEDAEGTEKLTFGQRCNKSDCQATCPPTDLKTGSFGRVMLVDDMRAAELLQQYQGYVVPWEDVKELLMPDGVTVVWDFDRYFGLEPKGTPAAVQPRGPLLPATKKKTKTGR